MTGENPANCIIRVEGGCIGILQISNTVTDKKGGEQLFNITEAPLCLAGGCTNVHRAESTGVCICDDADQGFPALRRAETTGADRS